MSCCECDCPACWEAHREEREQEECEEAERRERLAIDAWTPARNAEEAFLREMRRHMEAVLYSPIVDPRVPEGSAYLVSDIDAVRILGLEAQLDPKR